VRSGGRRRWGFRTRLTALIAVVFIAGGTTILGVQYLLVEQLFRTAIGTIVSCIVPTESGDAPAPGEGSPCDASIEVSGSPGASGVSGTMSGDDGFGVFFAQSAFLSREVLSGLLFWSVIVLLVFTVVAVFAASWLSGRSFARIGRITDTTRRITRDDLHQRLDLPGPDDEIKELGDTIDTMLDRLEASFTAQERFVTNASHELRTPLTTTRTALEIPLEQGLVPEELQPAIRRALDANLRSEQLIAALLELARATHAKDGLGGSHDLAELLRDSVHRHAAEAEKRGISVELSARPASVSGADKRILRLAIDNLVDNAIRHNVDDGSISAASGTTDGRAWVEIANTGERIAAGDAQRLIEPFDRGAGTRTAPGGTAPERRGLGLGLTLVHNIAVSLGAELALEPEEGGGLRARIDFPPAAAS